MSLLLLLLELRREYNAVMREAERRLSKAASGDSDSDSEEEDDDDDDNSGIPGWSGQEDGGLGAWPGKPDRNGLPMRCSDHR
jgi:hypothetical protein